MRYARLDGERLRSRDGPDPGARDHLDRRSERPRVVDRRPCIAISVNSGGKFLTFSGEKSPTRLGR